MALAERAAGRSVAQVLEENAREHPDRVFLVFGDRRLTYRQVDARSSGDRRRAARTGRGAGDRIALDLPNWPEFVLTMFAAAKLGAVIVPLNPRYTVPELQYMLRHSEATVVVSAETFNGVTISSSSRAS
jgi:acyl-CoA synthetase (AMP-forming)/AMP-acid ligase II